MTYDAFLTQAELQINSQFFDLSIKTRQAQFKTLGRFTFVGELIKDSQNVQSFVMTQSRTEIIGIGQRLFGADL